MTKNNIHIISLLIAFSLITKLSISQNDSTKYNNEFRLSSGILHNHIFRITEFEEDGYLHDGIAQEIGFTYSYPMDDKLWMGIGLSYLQTTNIYSASIIKNEEIEKSTTIETEQSAEIVYLPAFIRYDFNKWLGLRVGMSIEIALSRSDLYNQNGLGFFASPYVHYMPSKRFDIGLEPMAHVTAMLPIPQEFYQQHFLLLGGNAYMAFRF